MEKTTKVSAWVLTMAIIVLGVNMQAAFLVKATENMQLAYNESMPIEQAEEVILTTREGMAPILPRKVKASYSTGEVLATAVEWEEPVADTYMTAGMFEINGFFVGTKVAVKATVTVEKINNYVVAKYDFDNGIDEGVKVVLKDGSIYEGKVIFGKGNTETRMDKAVKYGEYDLKFPQNNISSEYSVAFWVKGNGAALANIWNMFVIVQSGSKVEVYQNGAHLVQDKVAEYIKLKKDGILLNVDDLEADFSGWIDDVTVYDTALTAIEAKELYKTSVLELELEKLEMIVAEVSVLNPKDYSVLSWMQLQEAVEHAKEILSVAEVEKIANAQKEVVVAMEELQGSVRTYADVSASYASGATLEEINDGDAKTFWNGWGDSSLVDGNISQWVMYDFGRIDVELTGVIVNWYDDDGGVIVPDIIRIEYEKDGKWTPVTAIGEYAYIAAVNNVYAFETITTNKLRMTMINEAYGQWCGASIYEWDVIGSLAKGKENLAIIINDAQNLNEEEYTVKSWKRFSKVLANAQRLVEEDAVRQDEIDIQISALRTAMRALVRNDIPIRDCAKLTASYAYNQTLELLRDDSREGYDFWNGWGDTSLVDGNISQWVMYDFGEEELDLTGVIVNWSADGSGTILPTVVDIEYEKDGVWTPVIPTKEYEISTGDDVKYCFEEIKTSKLRMTMSNAVYTAQCGAAIYEWDVVGKFSDGINEKVAGKENKVTNRATVLLSKNRHTMKKGEVYRIKLEKLKKITKEKPVYTSDCMHVATVTPKGVVSAKRKGMATITIQLSKENKLVTVIKVTE